MNQKLPFRPYLPMPASYAYFFSHQNRIFFFFIRSLPELFSFIAFASSSSSSFFFFLVLLSLPFILRQFPDFLFFEDRQFLAKNKRVPVIESRF